MTSNAAFYLSVQQSSSSLSSNLDSSGEAAAAMTKKTKQKSTWSAKHSASEVVSGPAAKYWSYKTTEITLESGVSSAAADQRVLEPLGVTGSGSSSGSAAISGNNSNSSASPLNCGSGDQPVLSSVGVCSLGGGGGGGLHSAATSAGGDRHAEGIRNEVKLPKNAVELIAWAITECNTTTPTLTQIATHIQAHVRTYRDLELSVLVKMVQHHLNRNNPAFFLPVMSPAGHLAHSPNLARWAINRQVVTVGEDGSLIRRRHRSHAYTSGRRCLPSSSSSPTSSSSSSSRPGSTCATPTFMSPPDCFSTGGTDHFYHPQFASYPGSTDSCFGPPAGPPMGMGPPPPPPLPSSSLTQAPHHFHHHHLPFPMSTMFGTPVSSAGTLPSGQPPGHPSGHPSGLGTGLYGAVPGVGAPGVGGLGTLPPTYQLTLC